jgi:hypothetical protein
MLRYDKLRRDRRKFLALTGLTPKEFQVLLPAFARAYDHAYPAHRTQVGKPRKKAGGGRRGSLESLEQKLLLALLYQKLYPVQTLLGEVFALSQSRANRWIQWLLPVLKAALDALGMLPERDPRRFARHERTKQEVREFIIDGTERRRQRPKNPEKQALHYSGKKKAHSDKNVVVAHTRTKRVGYLSQTSAGKTHDKKITDQEPIVYPRGTTLHKDTGFQGYEPRGCRTHQPKKKPRKGALSAAEKRTNRRISQVRVRVEHALAGVKRSRIVKDVLRNTKEDLSDLVMVLACGLHNVRVQYRLRPLRR